MLPDNFSVLETSLATTQRAQRQRCLTNDFNNLSMHQSAIEESLLSLNNNNISLRESRPRRFTQEELQLNRQQCSEGV